EIIENEAFNYLFILIDLLRLHAEVRLSAIFTDGMVLQQQKNVPIWGWARKGATVSVGTSWNQKEYKVKANEDGIWRISIQTPEAGGPYNIQVSEDNTITLQDILIGE